MPLTPQQRWARKQKANGECTRCGKRRLNRYRWLCDHCQAKSTKYMKRYRLAQKKAQAAKAKILGTSA